MSVVNKMLQDLEARKDQPEGISADYQPALRRRYGLWWLLLAAVIFAMFATWIYLVVLAPKSSVALVAPSSALHDELLQDGPMAPVKVAPKPMLSPDKSKLATGLPILDPKVDSVAVKIQTGHENAAQNEVALLAIPISSPPESEIVKAAEQSYTPSSVNAIQPAASFSISNTGQPPSGAGLKQSINDALLNGQILIALDGLQQLLIQEPENIRARKKLASLLFAENRIEQAKVVLQQGLATEPQQTDLRLMLAKLLVQQEHPEAAIQLLKEYAPSTIVEPGYYAYRGALAQRLKQFGLAQQDYHALVQAQSSKAKWWLGLAIAQDSQGNVHDALQSYSKADDESQLAPPVLSFVHQRMKELVGVK